MAASAAEGGADPPAGGRWERVRAGAVTVVLCLAVLAPLIPDAEGDRWDSFPLTWYPMFHKPRPDVEKVTWVRAADAAGGTRHVSYRNWTSGKLSEGRNQLQAAVREGDAGVERFCERLAERLARHSSGWRSEVVELQIVRSTWSLTDYFGGGEKAPLQERTIHRCPVERE